MITIGTRGSQLALAQAHWVKGQLESQGHSVTLQIIKTRGDVVQDRFDKMEGKGFFTKEIEDALLCQQIDLAVHSMKDLPTENPAGLVIAAIPPRENPLDLLVARTDIQALQSQKIIIGTSSLRRVECLKARFPQAEFSPIRGNVPTRLEKMARGEVDIVVLAQAGLNRLNIDLSEFHTWTPPLDVLVPAPAQGALALQVRENFDCDLAFLEDRSTRECVTAEREILAFLQGGCQLPLGVYVHSEGQNFRLHLFMGQGVRGRSRRFQVEAASVSACVQKAKEQLQEQ
ncbi:MAG: hydroxymethylbilane synthase [Acidobacteria bacterium]|nr:hydroxymethylbilane synthase [Acidobacteriota bacterium]MCB9398052.1 hydroxymethylbilane synthase [Acidobacteriota bacterium]